jgi:hypothetical protein
MSSLITEAELAEQPDDDVRAFLRFEQIVRARLDKAIQDARMETAHSTEDEFDYMSCVLAAAKEYDIAELAQWKLPSVNDEHLWEICRQFRATSTHVVTQLLLRQQRRVKEYSVAFDAAAKVKLQHLLGQIRTMIDKLEVSVAKKDRLTSRLLALEREIELERTPYQALAAAMIEAADDVGEAAKRLGPVVELLERVAAVFGKCKRAEEEAGRNRLPAPQERRRIEHRKPADRQSRGFSKQIDDEIPF